MTAGIKEIPKVATKTPLMAENDLEWVAFE